jgi:APA family basic amino acid/polyamine antiporter
MEAAAGAPGSVNVSVLVLRREEVEHEHFRAPAVFPVLGAIVSIGLIADTAFDDLATFARAAALVAAGSVLWVVNRVADR